MPNSTVPTKSNGDLITAPEINNMVQAINSKAEGMTQQHYVSGSTFNLSNADGDIWLIVDPSSTVEALTINLNPNPLDGQTVYISFGGIMTSGEAVTSLTIIPQVLQATIPENVQVGETIIVRRSTSVNKWFRIK